MEEFAIILAFMCGCVALMVFAAYKWKKQIADRKKEVEKYSAILNGKFKLVEGLPLASGMIVDLFYGREKITFKKDDKEISLECGKIVDMDTTIVNDAKSQAISFAIAGKLIEGGITGAAIGALAVKTIYFVIAYKKDDEVRYIVLDTKPSGLLASKIVKDFKAYNPSHRGGCRYKIPSGSLPRRVKFP